ncbi:Exocyst complex component 3 [Eumeta japonica]|uniref:Exocyst complex component 3 n=1 Tax=Eumeta variegata TaxID=151549 RepID=A0A4C1SYD6_EUMVA|nr:Exocyst complex component 3 [Eumeta japonica]
MAEEETVLRLLGSCRALEDLRARFLQEGSSMTCLNYLHEPFMALHFLLFCSPRFPREPHVRRRLCNCSVSKGEPLIKKEGAMDLQQLEEEARQAALKDIKNMLQRPGQLEKVEQYCNRVSRKKLLLKLFSRQECRISWKCAKTMTLIEEDKLLNAHQCLADLENARDDLLYELHKQPKQHASDKITLKRHFEKIETVSQALEKKLRLILSRTLNTTGLAVPQSAYWWPNIQRRECLWPFFKIALRALHEGYNIGTIGPGRSRVIPKGKNCQPLAETLVQLKCGGLW